MFTATLELDHDYQFKVTLDDETTPALMVDEAPPLGAGEGPNPARLVATAVGHCLGASLAFCLRKAHLDLEGLKVRVEGELVRNERGRLRIGSLSARLEPSLPPDQLARAARCFDVFEDYCIVTQSLRAGVHIDVRVEAPAVR